MKRIVTWALAATLTLGLFAPGVAQAHVKVFNTRLTVKANDTRIDRGQRVTFSGALKGGSRKCFRAKTVTIRRGNRAIASTTTNSRGKYRVSKKVRKGGRYRATYGGFVFGAHPHNHTCTSSRSKVVRIRIA